MDLSLKEENLSLKEEVAKLTAQVEKLTAHVEKLTAQVEKLTPAPKKTPPSGWQRKAKQESEKLKAKEVERKMKIAPKKVPPYENDLEEQLYEVANKIQCEDTFGPLLKSCAKQKKAPKKKSIPEGVPHEKAPKTYQEHLDELYPEGLPVQVANYSDKDLMEIYGKLGVKVLYDILCDMPCGDKSRGTKVQKIRRIIEYGGAKLLRYQVIKKVGYADPRADTIMSSSGTTL